ncbi:NAD(P)H-binding protein [Vibrio sp. CAIM 722]|uniref:NAD(P)H-binding protein n=1 Tax=Vibrio eleionomae TaxID=2653505 RepID=A0A7X4LND4_9VIBR|nr:NAD(P)H-binding protein [Vibrio eleionomae]MZI95190.1 NAD(P)H-binding protein [Vibrio eleionomae]
MSRVVIIGAGWLGQPLAQSLLKQQMKVSVTKTQMAGVEMLAKQGIPSFLCNLTTPDALTEQLFQRQCDTVIGCFPPGFRRGNGDEYAHYWGNLVTHAHAAGVKKIIMISSTSVYPNLGQIMHEEDASYSLALNNDTFTDNARILLKAEQCVIDSGLDYVIIRCSGLFGADRHPARFATRLKSVSSEAPANMLHQKDAIGITEFSLRHLSRQVINATTPNTVSKAQFYQAALDIIGSKEPLPPINDLPDKQIVSDKLIRLGYSFHYTNTLEALSDNE